MADDRTHPLDDPEIAAIVRYKVNRVIRGARLNADERRDLEQEVYLRLLERLPRLDAARGNLYALTHVNTAHAIADYLARLAARRDGPAATRLSTPVLSDDGTPADLASTLGQKELDSRRGVSAPDPEQAREVALDVAAALAALPDELRPVAAGLIEGRPVAWIARALGLKRTTVSDRARRARELLRASLRDYL